MTQDEIIEMARQAGATEIGHKPPAFHFYLKDLESFSKLVAAKEREACAKEMDARGYTSAADVIRARGEA